VVARSAGLDAVVDPQHCAHGKIFFRSLDPRLLRPRVENPTCEYLAMTKIQTVVFDTKSYDRESLHHSGSDGGIEWRFMDWRLSAENARAAQRPRANCLFVT